MVPIDLFDELTIHNDGRRFACSTVEIERDNIVERAFLALGLEIDAIGVSLLKRIPIGGGMGGGSSDAAAVLLAAQRGLLPTGAHADYLGIAGSLGSDVPFFLCETAALVEQTGDRVTALGAPPQWHAVVVKPPVAVSTAWAYAKLDEQQSQVRPRNASISLAMAETLQRGHFDRVVELLHNDFQEAVYAAQPPIALAAQRLGDAGARRALLTGSGSCVFALAADEGMARAILHRLKLPDGYSTFACAFRCGEPWLR